MRAARVHRIEELDVASPGEGVAAGIKLGNDRLRRVLGRGNMGVGRGDIGVVYLATDEALLRPTAVKVLTWSPAEHDPEAWFLAEAHSVARLHHCRSSRSSRSTASRVPHRPQRRRGGAMNPLEQVRLSPLMETDSWDSRSARPHRQ